MRKWILSGLAALALSVFSVCPALAAGQGIYNAEDGEYHYSFSDGTEFTGTVADGDVITDVASFQLPEGVTARLTRNEEEQEYVSDQFLVETGTYDMTFTWQGEEILVSFTIMPMKKEVSYDAAGNAVRLEQLTQTYDPGIKRFVQVLEEGYQFYSTIPQGMMSSGAVVFQGFTPELMYIMTRDGIDINYEGGQVLAEDGQYHLQIILLPTINTSQQDEPTMDQLQDDSYQLKEFKLLSRDHTVVADFYFSIVTKPLSVLPAYQAPEGYEISELKIDGKVVKPEKTDRFPVTGDGTYQLRLAGLQKDDPPLVTGFVIDTQPPLIQFENVKTGGVAKQWFRYTCTEKDAVVEVVRDGWKTETGGSGEVRTAGRYRICARDQAGNKTTYMINLKFPYLRLLLPLIVLIPVMVLGWIFMHTKREGFTAR